MGHIPAEPEARQNESTRFNELVGVTRALQPNENNGCNGRTSAAAQRLGTKTCALKSIFSAIE